MSFPPKGILFDLDDTLIAYSSVAEPTWRRLCLSFAQRIGSVSAEDLFQAIIQVNTWYWADPERHRLGRLDLLSARREIVSTAFRQLGLNRGSLACELADAFSEQRDLAVYLFEDTLPTLEQLTEMGIRLALMTNGEASRQRAKIRRLGLERFFDCLLIEGELGFGKPDSAVYLQALSHLRLNPEATWSIGDFRNLV